VQRTVRSAVSAVSRGLSAHDLPENPDDRDKADGEDHGSHERPAEGEDNGMSLGLHINKAPALRGNSSIHDFAGRWWFELFAILAALVALRSVLVLHGFLRRLGLRARHTYPGN